MKKSNKRVKSKIGPIITIIIVYTVLEILGVTALHFRYVGIDRDSFNSLNCIREMRILIDEINNDVNKNVITSSDNKIADNIERLKLKIAEYETYEKDDEEQKEYAEFSDHYKNYISEVENAVSNRFSSVNYKTIDALKTQLSASVDELYIYSDNNHVNKMRSAALQRDITVNLTTICSIIFLIVLIKMDRKRVKTEIDLIETEEKVFRQKEKINVAVLKDVLTETENRMSFVNRFSGEKSKIKEGYAYYFIMFNIDDFSSVNSTYGVKSGDLVLYSTAKKIMEVFDTSPVYRTGSDEFVVAVSTTSDQKGYDRVTGLIEKARDRLNTANKIKSGTLVVSYSVSVVKKAGPSTVDETVLGKLSESMKQGRITQPGAVMFRELD